jgi:hypothetical protein
MWMCVVLKKNMYLRRGISLSTAPSKWGRALSRWSMVDATVGCPYMVQKLGRYIFVIGKNYTFLIGEPTFYRIHTIGGWVRIYWKILDGSPPCLSRIPCLNTVYTKLSSYIWTIRDGARMRVNTFKCLNGHKIKPRVFGMSLPDYLILTRLWKECWNIVFIWIQSEQSQIPLISSSKYWLIGLLLWMPLPHSDNELIMNW